MLGVDVGLLCSEGGRVHGVGLSEWGCILGHTSREGEKDEGPARHSNLRVAWMNIDYTVS